ncbi:hypothetical protein ASPCAL04795 [Aspergillus calidoustus]|uniref:Homeobox and C2H2 transcription factor n=1 Tax=Aspergillus calidoustus TaxID=454130 RepID=A0A0U5FVZ4_ASPCI|nr:hypothetical protein ASPCAL04795 [Aspergillus calidoustus]
MGEIGFSADDHEDWWRGMEWSALHDPEFPDHTTSDRNQASDLGCIPFSTNSDEPPPPTGERSDGPSFVNLLDCGFLGPDIPWDDDEFFLPYGAWRPPEPCTYCRRMRLQCFSLQTTDANPNPVRSCSSCVALFRQCSLAERHKRQPHHYETSRPVIDQLHGIREDDAYVGEGSANPNVAESGGLDPSSKSGACPLTLQLSQASERASSYSRSVKRTRPLREWLACNLAHPYPTKAEKTDLAKQTGMTRTQINNWFLNARRRQRHSENMRAQRRSGLPHGSPMPPSSPLSMMTPIDRWRCSPPEDEPITISPAVLEKALNDSFYNINSPHGEASTSFSTGCASSSISGDSWLHSQPHSLYASSTPDSTISFCHSNNSSSNFGSLDTKNDEFAQPQEQSIQASALVSKPKFQCTFCSRDFKKKFDWKRHELSVHMPSLSSWVCSTPLAPEQSRLIWRTGQEEPECIFCGHASPSESHFRSHEFEYCAQGPISERTFSRKDHLWQHLYKFHGCRKWDGWTPDLSSLRMNSDAVNSRCGFCDVTMDSWTEREQHMMVHFLQGMTMASWRGGENGGIELSMPN